MTAATSRLRRRGIWAGVAALVGLGTIGGFAGAAQATADFSLTRVSSDTRFGTAIATANATFPDGVDTVVLVNAYSPADALAASYVAGGLDAAILVTDQAELNSETAAALEDLGATNVVILGGTAAVSEAQEDALAEDYEVTRFAGATRTETAVEALEAVETAPTQAFIVRAFGNPSDALAAGPVAYANGIPILLVPGAVTPEWIAAVEAAGITTVTPLGGTAAVPETVVTALTEADFTVNARISGASGPATAAAIAEEAITDWGFSNTGVGIARGDTAVNAGNAADALTSAQWLGTEGFPLLLSESNTVLGTAAQTYLTAHANTIATGAVFGGSAAVSASVVTAAETAGKPAATAGQIVTDVPSATSDLDAGQFSYADSVKKAATTATTTAADTFTVDGRSATRNVFLSQIGIGDTVAVSAANAAGASTYALTNVDAAATYTSGLAGTPVEDVDPDVTDGVLVPILEPITGTVLNTVPVNAGVLSVYKVGTSTVEFGPFLDSVNIGDTIAVTGGDGSSTSELRTVTLTNGTLTGKVSVPSDFDPETDTAFGVKTDAGATFELTPGDEDTLTVDGDAAADAEAFILEVSNGDTVSFAKTSTATTYALTNAVPPVVEGQLADFDAVGETVDVVAADGTEYLAVPVAGDVTVNGSLADPADLFEVATPGDEITFQQADAASETDASIELADAGFSGKVNSDGAVTTGTVVGILAADGSTPLAAIDYTSGDDVQLEGTPEYRVNGAVVTDEAFANFLTGITNKTQTGSLTVTESGTKVVFALTTALA